MRCSHCGREAQRDTDRFCIDGGRPFSTEAGQWSAEELSALAEAKVKLQRRFRFNVGLAIGALITAITLAGGFGYVVIAYGHPDRTG